MHSYLQRHIRTHGSGVSMPCSGAKGKDGVVVKANVGGVTTTTTLLNPITLETNENNGSLIVSQPALNIPPNTSQNYFMIQTASGLQLIPLSSPVPAPPPPPPPLPPAQPQNYLLLQCPSNNGSQSSLILVPTANNPPPAQETQTLPMLQSFQAVQSVLNQTPQAQISQFSPLAQQQQQQQARIIITSNNNNNVNGSVAMSAQTLSSSLLTKPILGRTTRTGGRRGRKPKSATQKSQPSIHQNAGGAAAVPTGHAPSVAQASPVSSSTSGAPPSSSTMASHCPLSTSCDTVSIHSTSSAVAPLVGASGPPSSVTMVSPATTITAAQGSPPPASVMPETIAQTTLEEIRTEEAMTEKQFVLCFDNEGESKEDMGGSYVLQFEDGGSGGAVDGGVVAEGNSLVLQIETNGQHDGEKESDKGGMMSLLHDWGEEKQGGRQMGEEGNQGKSYVLHFHTEAESGPTSGAFSRGQETSLQLTCTPNSSLVPLDGQEVVFKLGAGTKMEASPEEGMQMIALIGDEGGMAGELARCSAAAGGVAEGGGAMEGIFQIESGEGIVIIEVSTSGMRDGEMEREEGREICQTSGTAEVQETAAKKNSPAHNTDVQASAEDAMRIGPSRGKEMHFSD